MTLKVTANNKKFKIEQKYLWIYIILISILTVLFTLMELGIILNIFNEQSSILRIGWSTIAVMMLYLVMELIKSIIGLFNNAKKNIELDSSKIRSFNYQLKAEPRTWKSSLIRSYYAYCIIETNSDHLDFVLTENEFNKLKQFIESNSGIEISKKLDEYNH